MEQINGQVQTPPALPVEDGQAVVPPDGVVPQEALVQPVNTPPNPQDGQAQTQVDPNVQEALRIANQRQAEIYRLQQENLRLQQAQPQNSNQNPFNPQTQPDQWWDWKLKDYGQAIAQATTQGIVGTLMEAANRNSEIQWQQNHPTVDINSVKMFAQSRWGVQNPTPQVLDDAIKLMGLPTQLASERNQAAQNQITQFRQPNSAQPIRAQSAGQIPVQLKFETLLKQYTDNPSVKETWDKRIQDMFDTELAIRAGLQ